MNIPQNFEAVQRKRSFDSICRLQYKIDKAFEVTRLSVTWIGFLTWVVTAIALNKSNFFAVSMFDANFSNWNIVAIGVVSLIPSLLAMWLTAQVFHGRIYPDAVLLRDELNAYKALDSDAYSAFQNQIKTAGKIIEEDLDHWVSVECRALYSAV